MTKRDNVRRIIGWDIHGLESAVKIDGRSWSLALKIPWFSLRAYGINQVYPARLAPELGEVWRLYYREHAHLYKHERFK